MSRQPAAQAPAGPIVLGKMGSLYGIREWLGVLFSTEDAESTFDCQPWFIQKVGQWQQVQLENWKHHSQDTVVKLKGADDRDTTNLLANYETVVDLSQLPQLEERDYHWKNLIDYQVVTTKGYGLGKVVDMVGTGSNDVLVIRANLKGAFGIKECPALFLDGQVIEKVDLATCSIEVD